MMDKRTFLFVGARYYALERMIKLKLKLAVPAVKSDSFAHRYCIEHNIDCITFSSKKQLLTIIQNASFDILVSEGCPYILPVSNLKKEGQMFINLHPGLLPEIRGASPVNASILFGLPQGVTCHIMDDGIDTGTVISRVAITDKADIPIDLLYRLSFMAEADAFEEAYSRNFETIKLDERPSIYYTRKEEDRLIDFNDRYENIINKVKAFALEGQYAYFLLNDKQYFVKNIEKFNIDFLDSYSLEIKQIVQVINNSILVKEEEGYTYWTLLSSEGLVSSI